MKIFPSLISADLLNLKFVIELIDQYVDGYHIDIMDDHFVPNLTWGPMFVAALRKITNRPFQIHLMVDNPTAWISRLSFMPDDSFVFHVESVSGEIAEDILQQAKKIGWRVGLALNPATQPTSVSQYLELLDEILVMSVNPGFSGQQFIDTSAKVLQLREMCHQKMITSPLIGMDGGINVHNIAGLAKVGVDFVGAAAAIFSGDSPVSNIKTLRQAAFCV